MHLGAPSLVHAVRRALPDYTALLAPQQGVAWSYGELDQRCRQLAAGLRELGVRKSDVVVSDVPNVAENLVLQLALSQLGASMATVKDAASLDQLRATHSVRAAVCRDAGDESFLPSAAADLPAPPVLLSGDSTSVPRALAFSELACAPAEHADPSAAADGLMAIFSGAALTHSAAMALGADAARRLNIGRADRCCVSVTLCHAFGIGSGAGAALGVTAAVVLPAVGGIRGCGNPRQRAEVTSDVLRSTGSTLLFADTHTLHALDALPPAPTGAIRLALRGGVVKSGSGSDFLATDGFVYAGVRMLEMGKLQRKEE